MIWDVNPESGSRILIFFPNPDPEVKKEPNPGVKKEPDPGFGSATLHQCE